MIKFERDFVIVAEQRNPPGVILPVKTNRANSIRQQKGKLRPLSDMNPDREVARRLLDCRLVGLEERIGARPGPGWVKVIRGMLGMSTYDLASRMGIAQSRVCQLERSEVEGSLRLKTLSRVAEALNCRLVYVLVPDESLQHIVRYQAERKAAELLGTHTWDRSSVEEKPLMADVMSERLAALAYYLVDRRGLWRESPEGRRAFSLPDDGADPVQ